ncbi:MAG: 4-(cytidine 5'-diphospho)-2-C-methyl-D-erythritol kinase [Planctomycetota bacterium]|jgi:4-diphosphocytidyl-2-C-methyl-D-erythritol kinase
MSTNITDATWITMVDKEQITTVDEGLLVLAPAKINLSLLIAGKRPDGFHEIETVMAKVDLFDEILIQQGQKSGIELVCEGPNWAPRGKENLIYTACEMLMANCHSRANVKITLTKNIPAGTGLGSASSDAAATLIGVNRFLQLGVAPQQLKEMAAQLGSDVAFFLNGPQAFCTGRGEKIKKLDENFNFLALLILPDVSVSTKRVYANYKTNRPLYEKLSARINALLQKNRIDMVSKMCANMLESSCFNLYKEIANLKAEIESLGIRPLCLSGSGSAMFYIIGNTDEEKVREYRGKLEEKIGCKNIIVSNNRW